MSTPAWAYRPKPPLHELSFRKSPIKKSRNIIQAPLRALIQGPLLEEEESFQVKEVFGLRGWDWFRISVQVPNDIHMEINAMPYSLGVSIEEDRLIWNGNKHGDFELKSVYSIAARCSEEEEEFMGLWVWKVDTLSRIKSFMWQCLHNNIGVGDCLFKRHLSELDRCPNCLREVETIVHRLRDYEMAKTTWTSLGVWPNSNFFEDSLHIWLEKCWALWSLVYFLHCVLNPKISGSRRITRIRWEKPSTGWVRLNIDGSALGNLGRASCGGIIWNDSGDWLGGFSRSIGVTTSFIAELWALRDGLTLCHNMHYPAVDIQTDAKAVVDVINNPSYSNRVALPIVDDCRQLISQLGQVWIGHCYREANFCADFLARKWALQNCCFSVYQDLPVDLLDFISADKEGVFCNRAIPDLAVCL
ncbi:hypothetical protein SO802_017912 [Lithocarpus litseifolius]|uniref:RNase H type-1 domain-containing protein n=1 Tax=Lithocarpus litseifolius TaxID=425828 RepID=A0AAW2CMA7_9ROSI